jgi:hypothetical protein
MGARSADRWIDPDRVFTPDQVAMMGDVFEDVLQTLGLVDRDDPAAQLVAHRIVELVQSGVRDPSSVKQLTLEAVKGNGPTPTQSLGDFAPGKQ